MIPSATPAQLRHDLGDTVVAEGAETQEQLNFVQDRDIDAVQGGYLAPALPTQDACAYGGHGVATVADNE